MFLDLAELVTTALGDNGLVVIYGAVFFIFVSLVFLAVMMQMIEPDE